MMGRQVDWILSVDPLTLPEGASLYTLPPYRGHDYVTGYESEAQAEKRRDQVQRVCVAKWGKSPTFHIVKRERRVKRVLR